MENNCLVTKLKTSVDNPDLKVLGSMTLHMKRVLAAKDRIILHPNEGKKIIATILGDNDVVWHINGAKVLEIIGNGREKEIFYTGDEVGKKLYIRLTSMYDMSIFQLRGNGGANTNNCVPLTTDTFKYHKNIIEIGADQCGIVIRDINVELAASSLVICLLHSGGTCTINGDVEKYVSNACKLGRKSGTLTCERNRLDQPVFYRQIGKEYKGDLHCTLFTFTETGADVEMYNSDKAGDKSKIFATGRYNLETDTWTYEEHVVGQ